MVSVCTIVRGVIKEKARCFGAEAMTTPYANYLQMRLVIKG